MICPLSVSALSTVETGLAALFSLLMTLPAPTDAVPPAMTVPLPAALSSAATAASTSLPSCGAGPPGVTSTASVAVGSGGLTLTDRNPSGQGRVRIAALALADRPVPVRRRQQAGREDLGRRLLGSDLAARLRERCQAGLARPGYPRAESAPPRLAALVVMNDCWSWTWPVTVAPACFSAVITPFVTALSAPGPRPGRPSRCASRPPIRRCEAACAKA